MNDDLLRELARAKAVFQLRAIQAVIADQPSTPPGSTSNASPDATMEDGSHGQDSSGGVSSASAARMTSIPPSLRLGAALAFSTPSVYRQDRAAGEALRPFYGKQAAVRAESVTDTHSSSGSIPSGGIVAR